MEGLLDEKRNKELIILADLEKKENPAVEKGMDDHLQKKLHLIRYRNAAERRLAVGGEHDIIREIDTVDDKILERYRHGHREESAVKFLVAYQHFYSPKRHIPPSYSTYRAV